MTHKKKKKAQTCIADEHSVGKIALLISGISHRSKGSIKKWCCSVAGPHLHHNTLSCGRADERSDRRRDLTIWCATRTECNEKTNGAVIRSNLRQTQAVSHLKNLSDGDLCA